MAVVPAGFNYTEDDLQRIREIDRYTNTHTIPNVMITVATVGYRT